MFRTSSRGLTLALVLSAALCSSCRSSSSKALERPAAEKLAEGLTVDAPWIEIPAGLTQATLHNAAAIRAYRRLAAAGILRCNSKLTGCRVGPRGKHLTGDSEGNIRVIVGYLVVDDVTAVTPLNGRSAQGNVTLRFQPTFEYRQFRADFAALLEALGKAATLNQVDSDGVASAVFRRYDRGGWRVENIQLVKKTGAAAWRAAQPALEEKRSEVIVNLAPLAAVTVSSENVLGGEVGANPADGELEQRPGAAVRQWAAANGDQGAWIKLSWKSPVQAWEVILYDRPSPEENIRAGVLTFSDGTSIDVGPLPDNGSPMRVEFDPKTVSWVQFQVTSAVGKKIGLAEIEVFGTTL